MSDKAAKQMPLADTWEAEVEARVKALEGELAKAQAITAAREADVARLQAQVAQHEQAEKARRDATCAAYVEELRQHGASVGSPIAETDLAKVTAAFGRGQDDVAHDLGEAFRARSSALGGSTVRSAAKVIKLGANEDAEHENEMREFEARWGRSSARKEA